MERQARSLKRKDQFLGRQGSYISQGVCYLTIDTKYIADLEGNYWVPKRGEEDAAHYPSFVVLPSCELCDS